ncbi:unnamed protein product, partial [Adineta ricciae]
MNKTSKELDLSSIITQVQKDEDLNRPTPMPTVAVVSPNAQTNNATKNRSSRKQRIVSLLLCCLGGSCRPRTTKAKYTSSADTPGEEAHEKPLLPPLRDNERAKICLVIDLDETLVHSVFRPVPNADFIVPVEIDGQVHQ